MHFINGMERSETFFVIRAMALTGQQSGTVNLRLQFSTWMRPADVPKDMPLAGSEDSDKPGKPGSDLNDSDRATPKHEAGGNGEGL